MNFTTQGPVSANGRFFKAKDCGRTLFLRGVNLSGNVKQPINQPSHKSQFDKEFTFVGRPFPLKEADEHFKRLSSWGFNFLRFNVTWEAIEHKGPGIYDYEYINYVIEILLKAKEYGFKVFIDPHQDVWSRFTGGSGAPLWTLECVGFNVENLTNTKAALLHCTYSNPSNYPKMIWPTNYFKLACATMFTLFFGGKIFAPYLLIADQNIQDYLQNHYFNAVCELAKYIHKTPGLENDVVVGYDTLNEPSPGWIGVEDITQISKDQELRKGLTPSPFQAMLLGQGRKVDKIEVWDMSSVGPIKIGDENVQASGIKAWKKDCIWAKHGLWDLESEQVLAPHYFKTFPKTGEIIDFLSDCWKPFINDFTAAIRKFHVDSIIFVEPPVNALPPIWEQGDIKGSICYAPHWYDGLTLVNKHYNSWYNVDYLGFLRGKYASVAFAIKFGEQSIKNCFKSQLNMLRMEGEDYIGDYPTLIGEIGIPYDMDQKHAYMTGDYQSQIQALDANLSALEGSLLNFTLWNYCSDNCHEWGDQWNGEDLSLWSLPVKRKVSKIETVPTDLNAGGRALEGFVRPFPILTPGTPKLITFDLKQHMFKYIFTHQVYGENENVMEFKSMETVLYIPKVQFPGEIEVWVSSGTFEYFPDQQRLVWDCGCKHVCEAESKDFKGPTEYKGTVLHKIIIRRKNSISRSINDLANDPDDDISSECPRCSVM